MMIAYAEMKERPTTSLRKLSTELGISDRSLRRIRDSLDFSSYKIQLFQAIKPEDLTLRESFCLRFLSILHLDPTFIHNIWFSDDCHVLLNGFINKQNICLLGFSPPTTFVQKSLHSEMITVWCALSYKGISLDLYSLTIIS